MNMYYLVKGTIDGVQEQLFGSFVKDDCISELECERESWKEQGYKHILLSSAYTDEQPDPEVYADDIKSGLLVID